MSFKNSLVSLLIIIIQNTVMLRIIATFILIYLVFRILIFYIFPKIGQWYLNRYRDKFYRNNPDAAKARERKKKQGMHVRQEKDKQSGDTNKIGEYVDFEDIEDDDPER